MAQLVSMMKVHYGSTGVPVVSPQANQDTIEKEAVPKEDLKVSDDLDKEDIYNTLACKVCTAIDPIDEDSTIGTSIIETAIISLESDHTQMETNIVHNINLTNGDTANILHAILHHHRSSATRFDSIRSPGA